MLKRDHSIERVLRHVLDRRPGGTGVDHSRHAVVRREGHVDDRPRLLGDEGLGRGGVGHQPGPGHVQFDHGAEALRADHLGRAEELAAGVVDQDVDAAVLLNDPVEEARRSLLRPGCRGSRYSKLPGSPSASSAVSSSGSGRRPQPITVAPSRIISRVASRPRPVPAPESTTTLPSSRPSRKMSERTFSPIGCRGSYPRRVRE